MAWQFIVTDLNGVVQGEATQAQDRKVYLPHMRVPSCSFKLPIWHDLANTVLTTDCLVKAYRNNVLQFIGPVVSAEENGDKDAQTIAITAAGPFWRLTKRLLPASLTAGGASYATEAAQQDLGTIARSMLTDTNGPNFTGISLGTFAATTNGSVGPLWLKNVAEAITELSASLGSFEFQLRPTEPTNVGGVGGWPQIALFDVGPVFGTNRLDAIFEYGTQRSNVDTYSRSASRDNLLTRAVISVQGWPDAPPSGYGLRTKNASNIATRGWFEEAVNDAGVIDNTLRDKLMDMHLTWRKDPQVIVNFTVAVNATPTPLVDYFPGDTIRARAVVAGSLRFDAYFRIWGLTVNIDQNGNETVELELVAPS